MVELSQPCFRIRKIYAEMKENLKIHMLRGLGTQDGS